MDWDFSNEEAPERLTETECQPYGVNYGGGGLSMIRTSWNIYNLLDAQIEKSRAYQAQNQSYDIIVQLPQVDIQEKIRGILNLEWFTDKYKSERISTLLSQELSKRDEYWKDKITTYITSDVRKVSNED